MNQQKKKLIKMYLIAFFRWSMFAYKGVLISSKERLHVEVEFRKRWYSPVLWVTICIIFLLSLWDGGFKGAIDIISEDLSLDPVRVEGTFVPHLSWFKRRLVAYKTMYI